MRRVGGGFSSVPPPPDARQVVGERVETAADGAERIAVAVVVALGPARAGAEDQPAVPCRAR